MWNEWTLARACRTAPHLVKLYQDSIKEKGKSVQTHATEAEEPFAIVEANATEMMNIDQVLVQDKKSLKIADFFEDLDLTA